MDLWGEKWWKKRENKAVDTQGPILPRHLIWGRNLQKIIENSSTFAMNYDKSGLV
jgi:hypothetical protein